MLLGQSFHTHAVVEEELGRGRRPKQHFPFTPWPILKKPTPPLPREENSFLSLSPSPTRPTHTTPSPSSSLSSSPDLQFKNSLPRAQTPNPSRSGPSPSPAGRALRPAGSLRGTCGIWAHGDRPRSDLLLRRRRRVVGGQEGPPHRELERRGACPLVLLRGLRVSRLRNFRVAFVLDFAGLWIWDLGLSLM